MCAVWMFIYSPRVEKETFGVVEKKIRSKTGWNDGAHFISLNCAAFGFKNGERGAW